MRLTIKSLSEFKKSINTVIDLVSKSTANVAEKCIKIQATKSELLLTSLSNGSHEITLSLNPSSIEEEGEIYINYEALQQMTRNLPQTTTDASLEVFTDRYGLNYRLNGLGKIHENLFHNQDAFKGLTMSSVRFQEVADDCGKFLTAISLISSTCGTSPYCLLKTDKSGMQIYGQFSESGFVKYEYGCTPDAEAEYYLKHSLMKHVTSLGDSFSLHNHKGSDRVLFKSGSSQLVLMGSSMKVEEFQAIDWISQQSAEKGKVVLKRADLVQAIQWQSYGITTSDYIQIKLESEKILVKGSKIEEAAEVKTETATGEIEINLPPFGIMNALKAVSLTDLISLEMVEISIGEKVVKILLMNSWASKDIEVSAILYEQFLFNK